MKILLGISGGVDSATSAKILINEGHEVEGAVIVMHEYTEVLSAKECADELGIKFHVIYAEKLFCDIIKSNFVKEYAKGRTPNPCIICNEKVKFRSLYDYAEKNGFDAIATGHYAKVVKLSIDDGASRYAVARADDVSKDQSYMLYRLSSDILSKLVLPLSKLKKTVVREIAKAEGIKSADRKDSQEICFLPNGGHSEYIESILGKFPEGDFISDSGEVLGRHNGIIRYTVGQRKGLGISLGERAFVTEINPENNSVRLSTSYEGREELVIADPVFSGLPKAEPGMSIRAYVKVRYTAPLVRASFTLRQDGNISARFDSPVKAAPGQSAVVYNDEGIVLFGGFIC